MASGRLYCGTSGFSYKNWRGEFYPEKLHSSKFLSHYASRLNTVEVNYTFRRLPSGATLHDWVQETPPGFLFALKAHQRITHFDRLAVTSFLDLFFKAVDPLRVVDRLGPVLFQIPPNMAVDLDKLINFLRAVPEDIRLAIEFRHKSWFTDLVYDLLRNRRAALCLAESEKLETPPVITTDFVYFRLRKPSYSDEEREEIRLKARELQQSGKDVFLFFKHEDTPQGALYAEELLRRDNASETK